MLCIGIPKLSIKFIKEPHCIRKLHYMFSFVSSGIRLLISHAVRLIIVTELCIGLQLKLN